MDRMVSCGRSVALADSRFPFGEREKLQVRRTPPPRGGRLGIRPHRYRLARGHMKGFADRFRRLFDRQLKCLSDIVGMYVLKSCRSIIRKGHGVAARESIENSPVEIACWIDRIPAGPSYVSGMENGSRESMRCLLQQVSLDLCLSNSIRTERLALRGLVVRS